MIQLSADALSTLVTLLIQSHFNWFELQEKAMDLYGGRITRTSRGGRSVSLSLHND